MKLKETKTAHVVMPKDFINPPADEDTEIEVKISLLWLEEKTLPELTDDYLVEKQIAKDMAELRKKVVEDLEKHIKQIEDEDAVNAIHDWLIKNVEFELSSDIIEDKKDELTERLRQEYQRRGEDLDTLLKRVDEDATRIRNEIDKQSKELAKLDFIIPYISEKEELTVTQPELINHVQMVAQMSQLKKHQIKKLMEDTDFLLYSYRQLLNRKVANFLLNHSKREYVEELDTDETETKKLIETDS